MAQCTKSHRIAWLAALVWLGFVSAEAAAQGSRLDAIAAAIDRLGSDSYSERTAASRELNDFGPEAFVPLAHAALSDDAEVRMRARVILERHAALENEYLSQGALDAVENAAEERSPTAASRGLVNRVRNIVRKRAIDLLKAHGAEFSGEGGSLPTGVRIGASWRGKNRDLALLQQIDTLGHVELQSPRLDHESLDFIVKIPNVKTLIITTVRAATRLERLGEMSSLELLSFANTPIGDDVLKHLPALPQLRTLGLDRTQIGDGALPAVARQTDLRLLWLDGTNVTSEGMKQLAPLTELRILRLEGAMGVSGAGLESLADLPNLEQVRLKGTKLTVDDIGRLARISNLIELGLDHTNVGDDHLEKLKPANNLRVLWLSKSAVTDVGLVHLKDVPSLQKVYLHAASVTTRGVDDLRQALPRCQIYAATETTVSPR